MHSDSYIQFTLFYKFAFEEKIMEDNNLFSQGDFCLNHPLIFLDSNNLSIHIP